MLESIRTRTSWPTQYIVRLLIYHYAASTATVAFYRGGWRNRAARRGLREDTRGNRRMRRKVVFVLSRLLVPTRSLARGRTNTPACSGKQNCAHAAHTPYAFPPSSTRISFFFCQ